MEENMKKKHVSLLLAAAIRNLRMRKQREQQCGRDRKDRDNCSGSDKRSGGNNSSRGSGRYREKRDR